MVVPNALKTDAPLLIIANHVTTFDGPLIQYALPGAATTIAGACRAKCSMTIGISAIQSRMRPSGRFFLPGPLFYFLLTALFNVFPLPRLRDFQPSFAHAGKAMDRGYHRAGVS